MKAQVAVATGEQSWLGRLFSVDALNMLERFGAGSGGAGDECIRIQLVKGLGKRAADGLVLATHIRWLD